MADRLRQLARSVHPFEWAILGALLALSLTRLGIILWRADELGLVWTGTDSLYVADGMQYIAWVREAGDSIAAASLWKLEPTSSSFVHPGLVTAGASTWLGVPAWLAYLFWKPVAVVALFLAVRAFAARFTGFGPPRWAAIVLALFFVTPLAWASDTFGLDGLERLRVVLMRDDMWPTTWLWGYPFVALAVAGITTALLTYERDRESARLRLRTPLLALFTAWLQPWQGSTILAVMVAGEVVLRLRDREGEAERAPGAPRLVAATIAAAALPLVYYALLGRLDDSWAHVEDVSRTHGWPVWWVLVSIAPLAIPAALSYRLPVRTFGDAAVRIWPLVALGLFYFLQYAPIGTFSTHALQGITVPLAALAVIGVTSLRLRLSRAAAVAAAAAVVLVLTVPLSLDIVRDTWREAHRPLDSYLISADERDALRYLEDEGPDGGVLGRQRLGVLVPALAGRRTYVGHAGWTPDYFQRVMQADRLLSGAMPATAARRMLRSTGARYLLADCAASPDLAAQVRPLVAEEHRFGCATVYELRPT